MLLSGSDEAVGIDSGDNPDAGAEVMVASLAQLIIDRWIRNSRSRHRICVASAICKLLKKGDIDLSSRDFVKMTRTQPTDESLNPELAVDGYMWPRLSERSSTGDVLYHTRAILLEGST